MSDDFFGNDASGIPETVRSQLAHKLQMGCPEEYDHWQDGCYNEEEWQILNGTAAFLLRSYREGKTACG